MEAGRTSLHPFLRCALPTACVASRRGLRLRVSGCARYRRGAGHLLNRDCTRISRASRPSSEGSMVDITNRFKGWLTGMGPKPPLGTWLMAAAPTTAEALGYSGFDFLVVDMEHVPIEMSDLAAILRAIGCTPAEAVVRLAWNDQVLVKRALDSGAQTIMLPFVQTAEEASR